MSPVTVQTMMKRTDRGRVLLAVRLTLTYTPGAAAPWAVRAETADGSSRFTRRTTHGMYRLDAAGLTRDQLPALFSAVGEAVAPMPGDVVGTLVRLYTSARRHAGPPGASLRAVAAAAG